MAFSLTLDDFTPKVDNTNDVMAIDVNELQTAIEALEAKVGIDGSLVTSSLEYRLTNFLPATPSNPETKFLNGNKVWAEMLIGNGGYAANLYLTDIASTIVGTYKQISYVNDVAETTKNVTVNNNELVIEEYLFEQAVATTTIDSGAWRASIYGAIDAAAGDSYFKFEVFKRSSGGTETVLFSQYSETIENRVGYEGYQRIIVESNQPVITLDPTDRLGVKIYAKTTAAGDRTLYYKVGDGNASYLTTPLAIRHSQLRDLNGDNNYLHVTSTEKSTWSGKQDALGFTPENVANKVTSISGSSTDTQYASAKLLYDQLATKLATSAFSDTAVTGKLLTGYTSGAGTVAATDTILQAIQKLNGNIGAITLSSLGGFSNPMTTAGDIIYGGASGAATRLGIGTAGQVLKVNSGATGVEWGTSVSGGADILQVQIFS